MESRQKNGARGSDPQGRLPWEVVAGMVQTCWSPQRRCGVDTKVKSIHVFLIWISIRVCQLNKSLIYLIIPMLHTRMGRVTALPSHIYLLSVVIFII